MSPRLSKPPEDPQHTLHATFRIAQATLSATNLNELLHRLHEIVGELMPAKNFYVALLERPQRRLAFPYFVDERDPDSASKPLGQGLTEYVIRTGEPLLATPEVYDDLLRRGEVQLVGPPSIDWLGVPLRVKDETIGAIVVQSYEPGVRYREDERDLLTFVSSHVALAIERQRADQAVRDSGELLALDVTDRKVAEEALRQSRDLLDAVLESSQDHIWAKSLDGRYLLMNSTAATAMGRRVDAVIGKTDSDLYPAEVAERFVSVDRRVIETGATITGVDLDARDGGPRAYLVTRGPLQDREGRVIGTFGVARDITERRAAEEALRQSQERYRSFIEQSTEGVSRLEVVPPIPVGLAEDGQIDLLYDRGVVAECNDAMARMYGFGRAAELLGARLADLHDPTDPRNRDQIRAFVRAGYRLIDAETHQLDRHRRVRVFLNNAVGFVEDGHLVRVWGTQRDMTEQRLLEEQFRQAQKMEAVGQLAGGIAHDFNNILTAILGTCQLLSRELPRHTRALEDVHEIREAALRAAGLTRQLLAYSRRQVLAPKVLDLNAVVSGLDVMLRRALGEDVELVTSLAHELHAVRADPGQIEQVILNLAVNARDAMPHGGRLSIATANVELEAKAARDHAGAAAGPYVVLQVSDTGTGMSREVQAHLFEPFFTTKDVGKGTGLGLATVYGIVKQSGGFIAVVSAEGKGTTFRVHLPRVEAEAEPEEPTVASVTPSRGTETVLLAEDEDAVRRLSQRALETEGYTVLAAANAREALSRIEHHGGPVHLLLTDVVMPGMSGPELAQRVTTLRPGTRLLYISGYPGESLVQRGGIAEGAPFLQKPFTPEELVRKVREVLDGR
jgi:two-component system, cell cycle sensor histidine kinase and response regulator CckA